MNDAKLATVKPSDSFEVWHAATCRNYSTTDCRLIKDPQFYGRIAAKPFGPLLMSDSACATGHDHPIRVSRNASHIRKDARDDMMLWLTTDGAATLAQGDRTARMRPGDLVLYDQTQPFELEFQRQHCAILMTIPRPLLVSRIPTARRYTARPIGSSSRLGALAGSMLMQIGEMATNIEPAVGLRVTTSALDILATAIETELRDDIAPGSQRTRRLAQVKRYIMANLEDAELDLQRIAKSQNMAPRTLNRLFAAEGTTPIRWLWQQRLAESYKALAEGRVSQVIDAALSFGFSDPSHFSRAFKAAFGKSPHAVAYNRGPRPPELEN